MGQRVCPETSVGDYNCSLRNSPEEFSSHRLHGGSLISRRKKLSPYIPWFSAPLTKNLQK